jgi:hypothetical protein
MIDFFLGHNVITISQLAYRCGDVALQPLLQLGSSESTKNSPSTLAEAARNARSFKDTWVCPKK